MLSAEPPVEPPVRRRMRRDPKPHFKPDVSRQLDAVQGCPELQVPGDHLARAVRQIVENFDTSLLEAGYSSLGRHGFHPRQVLAVWIYGSLIGLHESTKLGNAMKTDAALRLLAGGHVISAGTLRRFRGRNSVFFEAAIAQTVRLAHDLGLLHTDELGVDSVRVRAHASTSQARTLARSRKRLAELLATALDKLSDEERERHEAKIRKHEQAITRCEAEGRTNFVATNPSAGLLKFPDGASAPGHRVTVVAAGVRVRLVLSVLMDADGHDTGKTGPALVQVRALLARLGIHNDTRLQAALDAGYWSEEDLQFAAANRDWVDILIAERRDHDPRFFGRDKFTEHADGTMTCPAGRLMRGPYANGVDRGQRYDGVGCPSCPLKAQCTTGTKRSLAVRSSFDEARRLMRERMAEPGAKARYNQRIATIEPVFANLESTMQYRRATTRHDRGLVAEVLLKLLAHNVSRLINARRLLRAFVVLDVF
jgi:transposase